MEFLAWLIWALSAAFSAVLSVAWFLLGGWVVTLIQLLVIVTAVFAYKYGWRRAPVEVAQRFGTFARFTWAWVRRREPADMPTGAAARREVRIVHRRRPGDVNVSTLLSLAALVGIGIVAIS